MSLSLTLSYCGGRGRPCCLNLRTNQRGRRKSEGEKEAREGGKGSKGEGGGPLPPSRPRSRSWADRDFGEEAALKCAGENPALSEGGCNAWPAIYRGTFARAFEACLLSIGDHGTHCIPGWGVRIKWLAVLSVDSQAPQRRHQHAAAAEAPLGHLFLPDHLIVDCNCSVPTQSPGSSMRTGRVGRGRRLSGPSEKKLKGKFASLHKSGGKECTIAPGMRKFQLRPQSLRGKFGGRCR